MTPLVEIDGSALTRSMKQVCIVSTETRFDIDLTVPLDGIS
jgi:hypothetical protein